MHIIYILLAPMGAANVHTVYIITSTRRVAIITNAVIKIYSGKNKCNDYYCERIRLNIENGQILNK